MKTTPFRDTVFMLRLSKDEKELLCSAATLCDATLTDFIRRAAKEKAKTLLGKQ
jgi:uncharacterized protein (DUF1778 family)